MKPFDPQEMVARVKALLRGYRVEANNVIYMGNIKLDRTKLEMSAGETSEQLQLKEFELLFTLRSVISRKDFYS